MVTPSKSIIIVDDDVFMVMYLEELLAENGYHVAGSVSTGEGALEAARKYHPTLVLMDIKLGDGVDGIQAAYNLRQELNIPCIFITGHDDRHLLQRAKQCRPLGYILKPLNEKQFLTDIEMAFFEAAERIRKTNPPDEGFPHELPKEYTDLTPAELRGDRDVVDFDELIPNCSFYSLGYGRGGDTNMPRYFS